MANQEATLLLKIKAAGEEILKRTVVTVGDLVNMAKSLAGAFIDLTEKLFDFALQASKFEQVEKSFTRLAEKQGEDAKQMLSQMRALTDGTITDLELMQQANNAMLLGLPIDRFDEMLKVAKSASLATGQSMEFMVQSIVTGIGRSSKLILDNLGIVVDVDKANQEYATTLGKVASSLTDAEKKQAFMNAALKQGVKNADASGDSSENMSVAFQRATAQAENLAINIGSKLVPVFMPFLRAANAAIDAMNSLFAEKNSEELTMQLHTQRQQLAALEIQMARAGSGNKALYASQIMNIKNMMAETQKQIDQQTDIEKAASDRQLKLKAINDQEVLDDQMKSQALIENLKMQKEQERLVKDEWKAINDNLTVVADDEELARISAINAMKENLDLQVQLRTITSLMKHETDKEKIIALAEQKRDLLRKNGLLKAKQDIDELDKFEAFMADKKIKRAQNTAQDLARMQDSQMKALVAVGKAASIALIIQDTARAIMGVWSWASALGPFGIGIGGALSGLMVAYGAEQIARVTSTGLAEGGIVKAQSGGMLATIGEGGKDEAVIPLEDGGIGMGTTINIIVNGGLLGDAAQARELAVALDKELLGLRRANQSLFADSSIT